MTPSPEQIVRSTDAFRAASGTQYVYPASRYCANCRLVKAACLDQIAAMERDQLRKRERGIIAALCGAVAGALASLIYLAC